MTRPVPSVLRELGELAVERVRADRAVESLQAVQERARAYQPRSFIQALRDAAPAVIAEVKRASPSEGAIRAGADPAAVARGYAGAGAAAISVLTEPTRFGGSLQALRDVRAAVPLPLLRKDFVVDPYQIWQGRADGADAALLIVALVGDRLGELLSICEEAGVDALVETHDAAELRQALATGAPLIGINNRDLHTLHIDLAASHQAAEALSQHPERLFVSESGLVDAAEAARLASAGFGAFLVGTHFMRQPDPAAELARWVEHLAASRT